MRSWRPGTRSASDSPDLNVSARLPLYGVLLLMVAAAAGCFVFVRGQQRDSEIGAVRAKTEFIAGSILRSNLVSEDLARPASGARERALDQLFTRQVLLGGDREASILNRQGEITYSTNHALIGLTTGQAASRHPGATTISVPLVLGAKSTPGSFALDVASGPIAA